MRLKRQFAQLLMLGGLAIAPTGTNILSAGGCPPCCWCGSPHSAVSQSVTAEPSVFSTFWAFLRSLI